MTPLLSFRFRSLDRTFDKPDALFGNYARTIAFGA